MGALTLPPIAFDVTGDGHLARRPDVLDEQLSKPGSFERGDHVRVNAITTWRSPTSRTVIAMEGRPIKAT